MDIGETLRFRSKEILLESDLSQSPLLLNRITKSDKIDTALEMISDNEDNTVFYGPICDAQSLQIEEYSDQEILNQMLDICPNELASKSISQDFYHHESLIPDHEVEELDKKELDKLLDSICESQTPIVKARKKRIIISDASSSVKTDVFLKPAPINQKRSLQPNRMKKLKKKKLDYSNPYFDLEASLSEESMQSLEEDDSNLDLDRNLSGLIAESPTVNSQEINYYRKSLLSPELGGLGSKRQRFRFATPKRYEPCTQLMPDSDTPGSLNNFVVDDDASVFSEVSALKSDPYDSIRLDEFLETYSSDHEI